MRRRGSRWPRGSARARHDALGLPSEAGRPSAFAGGIAFVDPRLAALGLRFVLPREAGFAALEQAGFARADAAQYDNHAPETRRRRWQPRSADRESPAARIGLRRVERHRLAEGLLYRPGIDRAHQVSRARQEAAAAGCDRRRLAAARHAESCWARRKRARSAPAAAAAPWRCCVSMRSQKRRKGTPLLAGGARIKPEIPAWAKLPTGYAVVEAGSLASAAWAAARRAIGTR